MHNILFSTYKQRMNQLKKILVQKKRIKESERENIWKD